MTKSKPQWVLDGLKRQAAINGYARQYYQPRLREVDKLLIYHPDEYRRYLRQNPYSDCKAKPCCDRPCAACLKWKAAKQEAARQRAR